MILNKKESERISELSNSVSVIMNGKTFNENSDYKVELERVAQAYIKAAYLDGKKRTYAE